LVAEMKADSFFNLDDMQQKIVIALIDVYKQQIEFRQQQQMQMQQAMMEAQGGGGGGQPR